MHKLILGEYIIVQWHYEEVRIIDVPQQDLLMLENMMTIRSYPWYVRWCDEGKYINLWWVDRENFKTYSSTLCLLHMLPILIKNDSFPHDNTFLEHTPKSLISWICDFHLSLVSLPWWVHNTFSEQSCHLLPLIDESWTQNKVSPSIVVLRPPLTSSITYTLHQVNLLSQH